MNSASGFRGGVEYFRVACIELRHVCVFEIIEIVKSCEISLSHFSPSTASHAYLVRSLFNEFQRAIYVVYVVSGTTSTTPNISNVFDMVVGLTTIAAATTASIDVRMGNM